MSDDRHDPLIGRTVGGAYLLGELIGVGGMGRVYRAEQNMLGRTVAVKVIHPHLLGDDQTVARFYNEARAASRLNHPSSVSIIDFGRTEDGILYLVMEYLAGKDLAGVLAEEGPLPFVRICRVLRHVLSALGEAHALGVVHRDLKPENVIVKRARRGVEQIKVVDFGLAHIVGPGGTSITSPGLVCGTPDYMAPEQGRGEDVDGRGDLYACGVVLFEMLTDRLPFEGETPTKVVFKHIHDPVPDPRQVAPHRAIPDDIAEVCLKALKKKPADRFQSADEFYEALRKIEARLETVRTPTVQASCGTCGAQNPSEQRFCGACGARLTDRFTIPPQLQQQSQRASKPAARQSLLIGRRPDLERLLELHDRAKRAGICVRLVGESGVGKTRLASRLAADLQGRGELVITAGPHPSSAPVPYWPIRQLVRSLLEVDDAKLEQLASGTVISDPIARAGISELIDPKGIQGRAGESRAEAVSVALATAIRMAQVRTRSEVVTLVVDDLWRSDSLSADVLQRLIDRMHEGPLFLVVTTLPQHDTLHGDESIKMPIRGLELNESALVLAGMPEPDEVSIEVSSETPQGSRLLLPLYLEQLRALGVQSLEDEGIPPRLADAVLARLERLDAAARRLMQVIAVLGDSAPLDWVREISRGSDMGALETLTREHLVTVAGERVTVTHPFVRELIESSIPAEHRKELHALALSAMAAAGVPLEVRAEHAWRAAEPMSALLLLERMGDSAIKRGDGSAGVLAFRRGLEVARRELVLTGDTSLDRAIVTFSRKLGDAMDLAGDSAGADGVLREALELAGPLNRERAKMLVLLSRVATKRNRQRDATRLLGQAIEVSVRQADRVGEAEANLALGKLRLADGDTLTAANTLKAASDLARGNKGTETLIIEAALARAEALRANGDPGGANVELELARTLAEKTGANALLATALASMAAAVEAAGERERAATLYREAATLAETAGDADRSRKWQYLGRVSAARHAG
jgi:serine/threonine protein kinase/tetratricopeptide (TPR) repeat protein